MFVPLKKSKVATILSLLLSCVAMLMAYQSERSFEGVEGHYFRLLQQQTARFASHQAGQIRNDFLRDHKDLIGALGRQLNIEKTRVAVLKELEKVAKNGNLFEVNYEFLPPQQLLEVKHDTQVLYDGVRLKGVVSDMVKFNLAMEGINNGAPFFFELYRCDVKRMLDQANGLVFSCLLRWYLLV